MPTSRPRHLITESDVVASALDDAAVRWPEDSGRRSRLIVRLIQEGHRRITEEQQSVLESRLEAVLRHAGALDGVYDVDDLTSLRADWPA